MGRRGDRREARGDRGDRDPDDWKKRREDDRASGFRDNRKDNRGRGRDNRGVVETDVTIGAMTEIGSGKIRRRPTRRRSSLTTLQSRLRMVPRRSVLARKQTVLKRALQRRLTPRPKSQAPMAPSVPVRRRQERRSQPRKSTSSPTHDTRISLISGKHLHT